MTGFVLAEFRHAGDLQDAARKAKDQGRPAIDALTPFAMAELESLLAREKKTTAPIGWVMFFAGALGAMAGYFIQWYSAVVDYPIISGNRPLNSWPAFLLVPYETTILCAGVVGMLGWLWFCGLPKLYHPLFEAPATLRACRHRYVLVFPASEGLDQWVRRDLHPATVEQAP